MQIENSISTAALKQQIAELEQKQARELRELKQQFKATYTALKPLNLLKSTIDEVVHTPGIDDKLVSTVTGLAAGYMAKMLTSGKDDGLLKKLLGDVLQLGITTAISQHPAQVKAAINMVSQLLMPQHPTQPANAETATAPIQGTGNQRPILMAQILDLFTTAQTLHLPLYHHLLMVPRPVRNQHNKVTTASLKSYRDKLRQAAITYHEKEFQPAV